MAGRSDSGRNEGMRQPRWKAPPDHSVGYYHCVSRVVDRRFVFMDREREMFRQFVAEYSAFCGVRVLTWCILSNHFHLLLEVPRKPEQPPPVGELINRLEHLSSSLLTAKAARLLVERWHAVGDTHSPEQLRQRLWAQVQDLSQFMKLLKQRFSQWFNKAHERRGTLWEERFRSVLIDGSGPALATVAAYIDLNPVRAGLVDDPKDYRWCGYAEAVAGSAEARGGLATALGVTEQTVLPAYRQWLFVHGEEVEGTDVEGRPLRRGIQREEVLKVLAEKGRVSIPGLLRARVRYLTEGAILGSREFINGIFEVHRDRFGPRRTSGARVVQGVEGASFNVLRAHRVRVFT